MAMKKTIEMSAAILLLGILCAWSAPGCSCSGSGPVCSAYWNTPVLFSGHVVRVEHLQDSSGPIIGLGEYLVHFEVTGAWRGTAQGEVVVRTADQGSACGYDFKQGHDYLVYGYTEPNGRLATDHCTRTHEISGVDDPDIQWIKALP